MHLPIQSQETFIAEAMTECYKCGERTCVTCLFCSRGTIEGEPAERFSISNLTQFNEIVREALEV